MNVEENLNLLDSRPLKHSSYCGLRTETHQILPVIFDMLLSRRRFGLSQTRCFAESRLATSGVYGCSLDNFETIPCKQ